VEREQIELTSQQLRDDYTMLRQINNPNFYPNPRHEKLWLKLAETLVRNNIQPRQYIKWAYDFYSKRFPVPYVNMLASDKTVKIFLDREPHMVDQEANTRLLCSLQQDTLRVELEKGRTPREIVLDSSLELGVVFRYAIAQSSGLGGLADRLRDQVKRELHFNPTYKKVLGNFLDI